MITLLSPAKIQDFKLESTPVEATQPHFLDEAEKLVTEIRRMSMGNLGEMLNINPELTRLNAERYGAWSLPFTEENAKPAVLVFNGEVYHGLDVRTLNSQAQQYLQKHLRLFSGLYGLLRPFDLIQPYRLDFGDSFKTKKGESMYAFWSNKVTDELNKALKEASESKVVVNLASGEYMKSIRNKKLQAQITDVEFLQTQHQGYKNIVVYTKKARGMMARFIMEHEIEDPDHLKAFDDEGYMWNQHLSKKDKLVFTR